MPIDFHQLLRLSWIEVRASRSTSPSIFRVVARRPHSRYQQLFAPRFSTSSTTCSVTPAAAEQTLTTAYEPPRDANLSYSTADARLIPTTCPGCGAIAQVVLAGVPGFYDLKNGPVKKHLARVRGNAHQETITHELTRKHDQIFRKAFQNLDPGALDQLDLSSTVAEHFTSPEATEAPPDHMPPPICDRCFQLQHHNVGTPITHPSIASIEETIRQSPHSNNHIYHVLDAADFPLSLIPNLTKALDLPRMRTQNRRSKSHRFLHGRTAEVSFIITRSDVLGPTKEIVGRRLPYLRDTLRDALPSSGKNLRLGNVHLVSAQRGWWTPELKEMTWTTGGAIWLVGKANVGKSNLFEVIFPKGRNDKRGLLEPPKRLTPPTSAELQASGTLEEAKDDVSVDPSAEEIDKIDAAEDDDLSSLLPPLQPETQYPVMPTVSILSGTTASPIRVPFGNKKGELIDLPGLNRGELEAFVKPEYKNKIIMTSRIRPERIALKENKSILLGGLVRITSATPDQIFLVHAFTRLSPHLTATEKAIAIQAGERQPGLNIQDVVLDEAKGRFKSAGRFALKWDATRQNAGSLSRRDSLGLKPTELPFAVLAADILIEGIGWVEVTAQVRRKKLREKLNSLTGENADDVNEVALLDAPRLWSEGALPEIEVFTPDGKGIGIRRPMNAFVTGAQPSENRKSKARPRKSMSRMKKGRQR